MEDNKDRDMMKTPDAEVLENGKDPVKAQPEAVDQPEKEADRKSVV